VIARIWRGKSLKAQANEWPVKNSWNLDRSASVVVGQCTGKAMKNKFSTWVDDVLRWS
jgi:hypothetical protein